MSRRPIQTGLAVLAVLIGTLCVLPIVGLTQITFGPRLEVSPSAIAAAWISTTAWVGLTLHTCLPHRERVLSRLLGVAALSGAMNGALVMSFLFFDAGWREGLVIAVLIAMAVGAVLGLAVGALLHLPLSRLRRIVERPTQTNSVG